MSEDSFVITYNDRTNFQTLTDIYESCHNLKNEVTILRRKNFELEGELVQQKNLNSIADRKYQRALQDIEHYKMKKLIEKHTVNNEVDGSVDVNYGNIYSINEENIQKQLLTEIRNCELECQYKELEQTNFELQQQIENMNIKYEGLKESHDNLKSFIEIKKADLLEISDLKLKINELEISLNSSEKSESSIYLSSAKIDELQVKCFKLENENNKYKKNHMNLLLLVEENTSLVNKIDRLEERLTQHHNQTVADQSDDHSSVVSNVDELSARKSRHLERENEILKSEQTQLLEKNSELIAQINYLVQKIRVLECQDSALQGLVEQKNEQIDLTNNNLHYLTRECESYKTVLFQFNDQSPTDGDVGQLLVHLRELCETVDGRKTAMDQQLNVLDKLTNMAKYRLDKLDDINSPFQLPIDVSSDRHMIIELRQQLEQLQDDLEKKSQLLDKLDRSSHQMEDNTSIDYTMEEMNLPAHYYSDMGFASSTLENEKNGRIFRKLTNELLDAVKKIFGYSLQLGPNGYLTVQSCFADDSSQLLEFKMESEPILLDNAYALSIRNEIDCKESFPAFLASLTLALVEQKSKLMMS